MAKKKKKVVVKKVKVAKVKESSAHFVTFRIRAVIPTQSFGNLQPEIEVDANTFEEARDFAMPHIEALYAKYAELKPAFMGKIAVTEKVVAPTAPTPAAQPQTQTVPAAPVAQDTPAPVATAASVPMDAKAEKAVENAKKAIANAATEEAAVIIQDQIEKSVKIPDEAKTELLNLCLKKRNELKAK